MALVDPQGCFLDVGRVDSYLMEPGGKIQLREDLCFSDLVKELFGGQYGESVFHHHRVDCMIVDAEPLRPVIFLNEQHRGGAWISARPYNSLHDHLADKPLYLCLLEVRVALGVNINRGGSCQH